jgi:carboxymethylenebutenolidase
MCEDDIHPGPVDLTYSRYARGLMSVAAAGGGNGGAGGAAGVIETDVDVRTADGVANAALFHPSGAGKWPAVLIWTDIFGLRPVFRDMGRRLAAQGFVVLVPNPFYRSGRDPMGATPLDFSNPDDRAKLMGFRGAMTNPGIDSDAKAYVTFLDAQPQTNTSAKVGVQGYCMGGALSVRTAVAVPDRIGAVASFHGGTLARDAADPESPHSLLPKVRAEVFNAIADNDDKAQPEGKDIFKAAMAAAKLPGETVVYEGCDHGWCVEGSHAYNEAGAERAWTALSALYKRALV